MLEKFRLDGKVAIVTGGSRGIGRAVALAFADAGADVVATARGLNSVEGVAQEIAAMGRRTLAMSTDISEPAAVQALVEATVAELGEVDILVNNAAISPVLGSFEEVDLEGWQEILNVNLTGTLIVSQTVARRWIAAQRGGCIVNTISILSRVGLPSVGPYAVTKGGLAAMTKAMAVDWARYGIRVNGVEPGYIDTEMVSRVTANPKLSQYLIRKTLARRFGEPEEVAGACLLLASDAGSYMSGTIVTVDGGWTAQ